MENDESFLKLAELARWLQEMYVNEHIYCANIIEELHANENAHSRILRMLLQYQKNREYPLFKSFISKFISDRLTMDNPVFSNEEGRIDVLIHDDKTAIVIENKICDAVDQEKQLERYLERVRGFQDTYVIYLTKDGSKKVAEYSLNAGTKEEMVAKGKFIELNYKEDIYEWIIAQKGNNCITKEPLLYSALTQYADYLGRLLFETNEDEQKLNDKINAKMKRELKLNSIADYFKVELEINQLQSRLEDEKYSLQKTLVENLEKKIRENIENDKDCAKYSQQFNWDVNCSYEDWNFRISFGRFSKGNSELTICSENGRLYSGIRRPENDSDIMKKIIGKLNLKSNQWWSCWRWMNQYCNQSAFWSDLNSDEKVKMFIKEAEFYLDTICTNE